LTPDDLLTLGTAFRSFDPEDLQTMSLDVVDDFVNGASILRIQDTPANRERLDIFKGVADGAGGEAGSIRVAINNGTGVAGQATEVADDFAALGFDTSPGTGDAERFDFARTVVRYAPGNEAIAEFVAAQVEGGADLQEVGSTYIADVIVVTGTSYVGLTDTLQPPPTPLDGGTAGGGPGGPTGTTIPSEVSVPPSSTVYGEVPPEAEQECS
ncbi:MAG TPA: LytR C-terminal domain-containing protein, partial [Acidimicrobiales bacterium]|nr:LytR C-terminal domain-containing protein [Acidimicrobiales bacterium]